MPTTPHIVSPSIRPDISFVMPCYNEEESIAYTISKLVDAFNKAGHCLELVAVDNGSWDQTGDIIKGLMSQNPAIVYYRIDKNEGYGHGIISGIPLCTAPWIGIVPADGQVDAEDVVRLYEVLATTDGQVVGKVRRRFRMDGLRRKVISITYNLFVRLLWPRLDSIDINGTPKILPREAVIMMHLTSKGWFLDPEIMIKAHAMGLKILEFNVFSRMRGNGLSHVRLAACWEFFCHLLRFRFSREISRWQQEHQQAVMKNQTISNA